VRARISSIEVFVVTLSIAAFSAASERSPDPAVTARRSTGSADFVAGSARFVAGGDAASFASSALAAAGVGARFVAAASAADFAPLSAGESRRTFCLQPSVARGFAAPPSAEGSGDWALVGLAIKAHAATQAAVVTAKHRPCGIIFMLRVPLERLHRQPTPSGWSAAREGTWSR